MRATCLKKNATWLGGALQPYPSQCTWQLGGRGRERLGFLKPCASQRKKQGPESGGAVSGVTQRGWAGQAGQTAPRVYVRPQGGLGLCGKGPWELKEACLPALLSWGMPLGWRRVGLWPGFGQGRRKARAAKVRVKPVSREGWGPSQPHSLGSEAPEEQGQGRDSLWGS